MVFRIMSLWLFPSPPNLNEQCSLSLCLFVSLSLWQIKKNVSAPQREVLFVSLTFSLSPQPQRAVLVVSLTNKHEKLYEYISLVIFYLFVFFSVLNLYIISTIEMEYQLLYTTVVELKQIVFSNKIFSHQQYYTIPSNIVSYLPPMFQ